MTGVADMSGVAGGFQAIVAESSASTPDLVQIVTLDSDAAPASPGSGGSTDHVLGRARDPERRGGGRRSGCSRRPRSSWRSRSRTWSWSTARSGRAGTPEKGDPDREARPRQRPGRPGADRGPRPRASEPSLAPSVAGHVVRVRVDRETGAVTVLADHVVQDVGRVLNAGARRPGQQHGAAAQARRLGDARGSSSTTRTASS